MNKSHTVVVIIEAKVGKEAKLKQALLKVIKPSRAEKACLEYHIHQDNSNPAIFILYEIWESQAAHQAQFTKPYIVAFMQEVEGLLAKPYQAFFAKEIG